MEQMKVNRNFYLAFLASVVFVIYSIFFSSVASASISQDTPFTITETQITTSGSVERPAIFSDKIIWQDYRNDNGTGVITDIYMYNLSTSQETQITTSGTAYNPAIYGDRIVWQDGRNGKFSLEKSDIYMHDLSTHKETRVTTNGSYSTSPIIYKDRIVWTNYSSSVHMYYLSTHQESQIASSESMTFSPAIYGNNVAWEDFRVFRDHNVQVGSNTSNSFTRKKTPTRDICFYNLSTHKKTQITTDGSAAHPAIYEDRIVYYDWRNGNCDIYMYNISTSTETRVSTNGSAQDPAIYGNRIVWVDGRNGNSDIYMYDLSTHKEIQITNSESSKEFPAIYENKIVWEDAFNGSFNIYMCTISGNEPEIKTPVANFSSNTTSGYAQLPVKFTDLSENATGWNWNFGDGNNSTKRNTTHTYFAIGMYTVTLTASNVENGTDIKKSEINVQSRPRTTPYGFNLLILGIFAFYLLKKST
jgi:beta propeller repeat protein